MFVNRDAQKYFIVHHGATKMSYLFINNHANEMNASKAERAIKYLTEEKGVQIQDIADRLKITRGLLASWRRSPVERRAKELVEAVVKAYPEYFPSGEIPGAKEAVGENAEKPDADIYERHIALLERSLNKAEADVETAKAEAERLRKELEHERDNLRREVADLLKKLKKEMPPNIS